MSTLLLSVTARLRDDEMAQAGGMEWLIILAIAVGPSALALADIARLPTDVWKRAGQSRAVCAALAVLLGPMGALLYFTGPRLRLAQARRALKHEQTAADHG